MARAIITAMAMVIAQFVPLKKYRTSNFPKRYFHQSYDIWLLIKKIVHKHYQQNKNFFRLPTVLSVKN